MSADVPIVVSRDQSGSKWPYKEAIHRITAALALTPVFEKLSDRISSQRGKRSDKRTIERWMAANPVKLLNRASIENVVVEESRSHPGFSIDLDLLRRIAENNSWEAVEKLRIGRATEPSSAPVADQEASTSPSKSPSRSSSEPVPTTFRDVAIPAICLNATLSLSPKKNRAVVLEFKCKALRELGELEQPAVSLVERLLELATQWLERTDSSEASLARVLVEEVPSLIELYRNYLQAARGRGKGLRVVLNLNDFPRLHALPWEKLGSGMEALFDVRHSSIVRWLPVRRGYEPPPTRILWTMSAPLSDSEQAAMRVVADTLEELGMNLEVRHGHDIDSAGEILQMAAFASHPFGIWHHSGVPLVSEPGWIGSESDDSWERVARRLTMPPGTGLIVGEFDGDPWRMFPYFGVETGRRMLLFRRLPADSIEFFVKLYAFLGASRPVDVALRLAVDKSGASHYDPRCEAVIFSTI